MKRDLRPVANLYNDKTVDHFIAVKHAWAWQAVRHLRPSPRVLETNAGYGWLTVTYGTAGARVTAIDRDAAAVECLRINTTGLETVCIHGDNKLIAERPLGPFDIIDIDATASPQPMLDAVLHHYRPPILFVTFGDVLHFRLNRGTELKSGLARYGDTWRNHQHELTRGAQNFGEVIGFNYIRSAWPDAILSACHIWPMTGSTRLAVTLGTDLKLMTVDEAVVWSMVQQQ
jgi:hypothetical protein